MSLTRIKLVILTSRNASGQIMSNWFILLLISSFPNEAVKTRDTRWKCHEKKTIAASGMWQAIEGNGHGGSVYNLTVVNRNMLSDPAQQVIILVLRWAINRLENKLNIKYHNFLDVHKKSIGDLEP